MKINITKTQRARLVKDWLNDMFSDAEIIDSCYVKNGIRIAYIDKQHKVFWFESNIIWLYLESIFSLEHVELQLITEDWVEETLKLKKYATNKRQIYYNV